MNCAQCGTKDTPCWREGPDGARTLCNACGIRWKRRMGKTKRSSSRNNHGRSLSPGSSKQRKNKSDPVNVIRKPRSPTISPLSPSSAPSALTLGSPPPLSLGPSSSLLKGGKIAVKKSSPRGTTTLSTKLLERILCRLEELEISQANTNIQVRELSEKFQSQDVVYPPEYYNDDRVFGFDDDIEMGYDDEDESGSTSDDLLLENKISHIMKGDGSQEALMLAMLRQSSAAPSTSI